MKSDIEIKRIIVKPVPRESVQNRQSQTYHRLNLRTKQTEAVATMNKNKAKNAADELTFELDKTGSKYKTGLEERVANPFKGFDKQKLILRYNLSDEWNKFIDDIVESDYISLQTNYEILDGVDPNFYTSKVTTKKIPGSIFRDPNSEPSFIENFRYVLYDRANIITNESIRGRFGQLLVKNNSRVAEDKTYNPNVHFFYIAEENEEQVEQLKKDDLVNEAIFKLVSLERDYPGKVLEQFSKILTNSQGIPLIKGEVPMPTVRANLNNYIKGNSRDWAKNIEKFNFLYSLFKDNKERYHLEYVIQEAINTNVMSINNGYIFWHSMLNNPTLYKWDKKEKLIEYLSVELEKYNPKEKDMENAYQNLITELSNKGIKVE